MRHAGRRVRPRRDRRADRRRDRPRGRAAGDVERAGGGDDRGGDARPRGVSPAGRAAATRRTPWPTATSPGSRPCSRARAPSADDDVVHHPAGHPYVDNLWARRAPAARGLGVGRRGARIAPVCGSCTSTSGSSSSPPTTSRAWVGDAPTRRHRPRPHRPRPRQPAPACEQAAFHRTVDVLVRGGRRRDDADTDAPPRSLRRRTGRRRRPSSPHPHVVPFADDGARTAAGRGDRHGIYVHAGPGRPNLDVDAIARLAPEPPAPPGARARPPAPRRRRRSPRLRAARRRPAGCTSTCARVSTTPSCGPAGRPPSCSSCRTGGAPTPACSRPPTTSARPCSRRRSAAYGDQGAAHLRRRPDRRRRATPSPGAPAVTVVDPPPGSPARPRRASPAVHRARRCERRRERRDPLVRPRPRRRPPRARPRRDPEAPQRRSSSPPARASRRAAARHLDVPVVALPGDVPAPPTADHRTVAPRARRRRSSGARSAALVAAVTRPRLHDGRRRRLDGGHGAGPPARAPRRHRPPERAPRATRPTASGWPAPTSCGCRSTGRSSRSTSRRTASTTGGASPARSAASTTPAPTARRPAVARRTRGPARRHRRDDLRRRGRGAGPPRPPGGGSSSPAPASGGAPTGVASVGHVERRLAAPGAADVVVASAGLGCRRRRRRRRRPPRPRRRDRDRSTSRPLGSRALAAAGLAVELGRWPPPDAPRAACSTAAHAPRPRRRGRRSTTGNGASARRGPRSIEVHASMTIGVVIIAAGRDEHLARRARRRSPPSTAAPTGSSSSTWPTPARRSTARRCGVERVAVAEREAAALPLGAARNAGADAPRLRRDRLPRRRLHPRTRPRRRLRRRARRRTPTRWRAAACATCGAGWLAARTGPTTSTRCSDAAPGPAGAGARPARHGPARAVLVAQLRRRGRRPGGGSAGSTPATAATAPRTPTSACAPGGLGIPLLWVAGAARVPPVAPADPPRSRPHAPRSSPTPVASTSGGGRGR